eukprot:7303448-Alexandrium_andersonii.AAC.1
MQNYWAKFRRLGPLDTGAEPSTSASSADAMPRAVPPVPASWDRPLPASVPADTAVDLDSQTEDAANWLASQAESLLLPAGFGQPTPMAAALE